MICPRCMLGELVALETGSSACPRCHSLIARPTPKVPELADLLAFAKAHPKPEPGQIRAELGISETRYSQLTLRAIEDPKARLIDPGVVDRLRRRRDALALARRAGHPTGGAA